MMTQENSTSQSRSKGQKEAAESHGGILFLRLHLSPERIEDYPLAEKIYSIGRALSSNIRIASTSKFLGVSLNHGLIEVREGKIYYIDRSTNGTYRSRKKSDFEKLVSNVEYELQVHDRLKFDTLLGEILCEDISTPGTLVKKGQPPRSTIVKSPAGPQVPKRNFLQSTAIAGGERIELTDGLTKIGRHYDNDIIIEDTKEFGHISRHHAEIEIISPKWWFKDLGSAHGSHIKTRDGNFYKLKANQPYRLTHDCVIRIGYQSQEEKGKLCDLRFIEEE
jgi:pSer/pThr/pTyr-binding forkhead associated (FHA) protein